MKKQWPLDTAVSFDPYYGEPDRDGDQGYEILADGRVFLRVKAPNAREVAGGQQGRFARKRDIKKRTKTNHPKGMARQNRGVKSSCFTSRYRRRVEHTSGQQGVE